MFSLVGISVFLVLLVVTPQDPRWLIPSLALAAFGYAIDLRLRRLQPEITPQLPWVLALVGWGVLSLVLEAPGLVPRQLWQLVVPLAAYLLIAHGVQTFRALQSLAAVMLLAALFVSVIAVEQRVAPQGCFKVDEARLTWDGRLCNARLDCERDAGAEAGVDYECERVGLLGTQSLGGRVRYQGWLADPDQLALVMALALPFAFAFFERKRSTPRALVWAASLGLALASTTLSRSRIGQLALLTVLSVYLVRRFGLRGLLVTGLLVLPLWQLGGGDAMLSTADQHWYEGMLMFRESPLFGVGLGQFTEHHILIANNSLVVAAAELGLVGLWLWSMVMYLSLKIPVAALRRLSRRPEAEVARSWALALLAAGLGLMAASFFLPWLYQELLWIYVGLSGALYSTVRTHDPQFRVRAGWGELAAVATADVIAVVALLIFTALGQ